MRESGEMYLETILVLGREKNKVRAIDIVDKMKKRVVTLKDGRLISDVEKGKYHNEAI